LVVLWIDWSVELEMHGFAWSDCEVVHGGGRSTGSGYGFVFVVDWCGAASVNPWAVMVGNFCFG
jgi:hypothetical protein